jgi:predicted RNA-binding Zn ribbon-like protein
MISEKLFTIGGAVWINLANTIAMHNDRKVDLLEDPSKRLQWLEENELLHGKRRVDSPPDELLPILLKLRSICSDALSEIMKNGRLSNQTFSRLEETSNELVVVVRMTRQDGKLHLIYDGRSLEDRIRYAVITSMVETLGKYLPERIRKCEHESCVLHFVDTSKGGKRRWCSMEWCGNRQKAADFYARQRDRIGR